MVELNGIIQNVADLEGTKSSGTLSDTLSYNQLSHKPSINNVELVGNKTAEELGLSSVQSDWNETDSSKTSFIKNKPFIPAPQVSADWNANSGVAQILNKPLLSTVASTGNYNDLNYKPDLATVATSGDYDDLLNKPTIPTKTSDLNNDNNFITSSDIPAIPSKTSDLTNDSGFITNANIPTKTSDLTNDSGFITSSGLATVATTGNYNDLSNKPTIPAAQINSDWNSASGVSKILNKPSLATIATTGNYNDLINTPSIPTKTSDLINDSNFVLSSSLATIATTGNYSDLTNKPSIPAAQVNSDWNSTSGVSKILNKPTIPTNSDFSLTGLSDVNITSTPNNNDGLKYNQATGKWVNGSVASSVGQLTDVDDTNKANNTSLVYNSNDSEWQAKKLTVTLTQAEYDQLKLDGDLVEGTHYVITDGQNVTCELGDLDDVTISSASNGQILQKTASGWKNTDGLNLFNITKHYASGSTTDALTDLITTYGHVNMMFAFDVPLGYFTGILTFQSNTTGSGYIIQTSTGRFWVVGYVSGTITLYEKT